ncbi:MAG: hypothetical protein EA420_16300 [Candidatus Competibacteraceae bacterium]|nr:MAG: hypothetical protein EA420_16300 [Candidatus Competibacteraceae bacterium]
MADIIFVWNENQSFNYGGFAKYLAHCENVNWRAGPGKSCLEHQFLKALEIELNVDQKAAEKVYKTMKELGFVSMDRTGITNVWEVSILERLRQE